MTEMHDQDIPLAHSSWAPQPWQVLAGRKNAHFALERELRLFQLKYWLTGECESQIAAFKRAARMFGLWFFQIEVEAMSEGSFVERMKSLIRDREARKLINHCFKKGMLLRASDEPRLSDEGQIRQERRKYLVIGQNSYVRALHLGRRA